MVDFVAWHGKSLSEHVATRDGWARQGYRFTSLSIYGAVDAPRFAAVMIRRPVVVAQRDWPCLTGAGFQAEFDAQASQGMGPVMVAATGLASDARFAVVFQPMNPIPLTRFSLRSGDAADAGTIQGMNVVARSQNLYLHWAAAYGDASDPRYCAVWLPTEDHSLWNADGIAESSAAYQARFSAQASAWCRPQFVTVGGGQRCLSVFTDRQVGPWVARHDLTPMRYQQEFDTWTKQGFYPTCVQAAGDSADGARFAALFTKSEDRVPRVFTPTGPTVNAQIDEVIHQAMQSSPVKHAALAITHGTRLVYARGYTNAEPDWPVAQPTTTFRMASVSKLVCAIAIRQLIDAKLLNLTDRLQDHLHLKTPSGGSPTDPRFADVTIQHLLEHKSGLDQNAFLWGDAVQHAYAQAGTSINLPVSADQTDAYVASLPLVSDPGSVSAYNNCGYTMLGRVVKTLRGTTTAADAFQTYVCDPIGISRIRRSASRVSSQPGNEARYQSPTLALQTSDMSNDRPLVPAEYGDEQLEICEGSGGLSGAVVDQARLIAAFVTTNDTAMLPRSSVTALLDAGAKLTQAHIEAGYGFDSVSSLGGGNYQAQKGGSLETSNNVLSFDGQWGLVMAWASPPLAADATWYPYYPAVMDIAKAALANADDLFSSAYAMPPL